MCIMHVVGWPNQIFVSRWIKAPFFAHKFLMIDLSILEGVTPTNFSVRAEKQNGYLISVK